MGSSMSAPTLTAKERDYVLLLLKAATAIAPQSPQLQRHALAGATMVIERAIGAQKETRA